MRVLTLGTFDTPHFGHLELLMWCSRLAGDDVVFIGLNTDEFVLRYKKKPALFTYKERCEALQSVGFGDIEPNNQTNGSIDDVVAKVNPELIVIGSDWGKKDYLGQLGITWEYLEQMGIGLVYVPRKSPISSSNIKERLKNE